MVATERLLAIRDLLLVYALIFVSGTHMFLQSPNKYLVLIFLGASVAWLVWSDRKVNNLFMVYLIIFIGFLFTIHLYTDKSLTLSSVIGTGMKLVLPYLILKILEGQFVATYLKLVAFLAAVSLFGFLVDRLGILTGLVQMLPHIEEIGYGGILYVYSFQQHIDRNNSIFFEPGAYQFFLNAALYMLFFCKIELSQRSKFMYFFILLIALLTTLSTTGFLIFGLILVLLFFKSDFLTSAGKVKLILLILVGSVVFAAQFKEVMVEKFDKFFAIQDITDTQDRRSFDTMVDIELIKRNLFGIGYVKYDQQFAAIGQIGEGSSSSNGITKTLAIYGLPFTLFLFFSYATFFFKFHRSLVMKLGGILMVLMFLAGEAYYVFSPILMTLIAAIFVYSRRDGLAKPLASGR